LTDLPIEPILYTDDEFAKKIEDRDPFLLSILHCARQLKGSPIE